MQTECLQPLRNVKNRAEPVLTSSWRRQPLHQTLPARWRYYNHPGLSCRYQALKIRTYKTWKRLIATAANCAGYGVPGWCTKRRTTTATLTSKAAPEFIVAPNTHPIRSQPSLKVKKRRAQLLAVVEDLTMVRTLSTGQWDNKKIGTQTSSGCKIQNNKSNV